jgi:hypothetical protein
VKGIRTLGCNTHGAAAKGRLTSFRSAIGVLLELPSISPISVEIILTARLDGARCLSHVTLGEKRFECQIRQAEITHVRIDAPFVFAGAPKVIVSAVQAAAEFVYVRIEEPLDPFPLPK